MAGGGVVVGEYRGDAALRPAAGAVEQPFFGDQADLAPVGQMQRERQPGKASADDQYFKMACHIGMRERKPANYSKAGISQLPFTQPATGVGRYPKVNYWIGGLSLV